MCVPCDRRRMTAARERTSLRPGPPAPVAKPEALGLNVASDLGRRTGKRVVEAAADFVG